ncbi:thioesterase family protein [Frankia sp. CcI49]|uniref:thioesterase family protein n=1 Tax=Frankia sp. CcI49 TaxID=1745382 RepID=UPI000A059418|nr:thioesterase family protein [Frankia sp. CcI49]
MNTSDQAFFLPVGTVPAGAGAGSADAAVLRATPTSHGPWSERQQHGGATSAVLTRALEQAADEAGLVGGHLARIAVDFLAPVPVGDVQVKAAVVRPGRKVALLRAEVGDGERTWASAQAWWRRVAPGTVPDLGLTQLEPLPAPETVHSAIPDSDIARFLARGYIAAVDWRPVDGHVVEPGPCTVWARPQVPLVAGETISPTQLTMLLADAGSGVSAVLDPRTHLFTNVDLVASLLRQPEGEWISMRATTMVDNAGGGTTTTVLGDVKGTFGQTLHTLFVAPHG